MALIAADVKSTAAAKRSLKTQIRVRAECRVGFDRKDFPSPYMPLTWSREATTVKQGSLLNARISSVKAEIGVFVLRLPRLLALVDLDPRPKFSIVTSRDCSVYCACSK